MALSTLSHKRNRSACTAKTQSSSSEPASKLSKLNAIFSKLTSSLRTDKPETQRRRSSLGNLLPFLRTDNDTHHDSKDNTHRPHVLEHNRVIHSPSVSSYSQVDSVSNDNDDGACRGSVAQRRNSAFAADDLFERRRYLKMARKEISCPRLREQQQQQESTQPQGLQPPPPPSILIKKDTPSRHRHSLSAQSAPRLSAPQKTHIRHGSHVSSSNMTVASEHLTAKEFADIAGIRIVPDDDGSQIESENDEIHPTTLSSQLAYALPPPPSMCCNDSDFSVASCLSVQSCRDRRPQIWDTHFWRHPAEPELKPRGSTTQLLPVLSPPKDGTRKTKVHHRQTLSLPPRTDEPPIMGELRRMRTVGDHNHQATLPSGTCVIRKGRFEIQLEASPGDAPAPKELSSS